MRGLGKKLTATLFLCCVVWVASGVGSSGSDQWMSEEEDSDLDYSASGNDESEDDETGARSQDSQSEGSDRSHNALT
jgi:hypothetical protein